VIAIIAVIVAAAVTGYGAEYRYRQGAERLARRLMWTVLWMLMPVIAFFNIASLHIDASVGAGIGFAWLGMFVTLLVAYLLGTRVLHLPRPSVGALMCASVFGNTAFLGLPFSVALFGFDELGNAVAYDNLVSTPAFVTVGFSVAAAFGAIGGNARERAVAFLTRNPPLWAALAGLVAPEALAPDVLVDASRALALAILPIGFFAVGVNLAAEAQGGVARFPPRLDLPVACAVGLKLVVPPLIVLALSRLVIDVPEVYLTQAAMASAINNLVVAHEFELDRGLVAAAIAWSTAVVVVAGTVLALL
jgi:malate permease and related proteins